MYMTKKNTKKCIKNKTYRNKSKSRNNYVKKAGMFKKSVSAIGSAVGTITKEYAKDLAQKEFKNQSIYKKYESMNKENIPNINVNIPKNSKLQSSIKYPL